MLGCVWLPEQMAASSTRRWSSRPTALLRNCPCRRILDLDGGTLIKVICWTIPDYFGGTTLKRFSCGYSLFLLHWRSGIILAAGTCLLFNWAKGSLTGCGVSCLSNCLHSALSSQPACMDPLSEVPDLSTVLRCIMTWGWGCSASSEPSPYLLIVPVSLESTCFLVPRCLPATHETSPNLNGRPWSGTKQIPWLLG